MLGFGVFAAAKKKEIRVLILRGIYDIADIRIKKILFHNDLFNFELVF
jgi:nucleoside phosphorylase